MNFLLGFLGQIIGLIGGGIGGAISMVTGLAKTGFNQVLQYNHQAIALSKTMGLNAKEAQSYTSVLITRAKELGHAYGIAAEQVIELQKNITDATGKQLMLNNVEAERMLQINQLVGSGVQNQFMTEMMNGMGAQLNTVQGAVSKAYATAAKSGLNAAQFSEKVAKNLSMANKLSFKDGVNGIIRMTALSEKLGMNMQSIGSAAEKFLDLDKSIENAAQMQMLGGSAAVNFGNPLTAAFEANYDPEAFAQRLSDSLASYATFDASKGIASINGMNMDFVRNIAKVMGISTEDAAQMAKKQSEIRFKQGAFGATLGQYSKEEQDFILNKSYVQDGRLMMNDVNGNAIDIAREGLSPELIKELSKFEGQSDRDIMESQARSLISIEDKIKGWETTFFATISDGITQSLPQIQEIVNILGRDLTENIAKPIATGITNISNWITSSGEKISAIYNYLKNGIGGIMKFAADNIKAILIAFIAYKGAKFLWNMPTSIPKLTKEGTLGQWILDKFKGGGGAGSPAAARSGGAVGSKLFGGIKNFANGVWKTLGANASKVIKGGGIGLVGTLGNIGTDALVNKGTVERGGAAHTALKVGSTAAEWGGFGAALGSIIPGLGTSIGAAIGATLGAGKGYYDSYKQWKENPKNENKGFGEYVSMQMNGIGVWFKDTWSKTVDKWNVLTNFIGKKWDGLGSTMRSAWNTFKTSMLNSMSEETKQDIKAIIANIQGKFDSLTQNISDTWNSIANSWDENVAQPAAKIWQNITNAWNTQIIQPIAKAWNSIANSWDENVAQPAAKIWQNITNAWNENIVNPISNILGDIASKAKSTWEFITNPTKWLEAIGTGTGLLLNKLMGHANGGIIKEANPKIIEKHDGGGIIGGNSLVGDKILGVTNGGTLFGVNSREMVLNMEQQSNLFAAINNLPTLISKMIGDKQVINTRASNVTSYSVSTLLANKNDVKAKPVGEKEYVYVPNRNETANVGNNTITVKDFNINLSGTLKLDAGNISKNVDMNSLLNDFQFMNALKEMIKTSINNDMNGGRFMNDWATMRGQTSPLSVIR